MIKVAKEANKPRSTATVRKNASEISIGKLVAVVVRVVVVVVVEVVEFDVVVVVVIKVTSDIISPVGSVINVAGSVDISFVK